MNVVKELADGIDVAQVVVAAAGDDNVGCAALFEFFDDEGAQEAGAASDDDALVLPELAAVGPVFGCRLEG